MGDPEELETTAFKTNLIKPENTVIQNISIDSAFIENTNPQQVNLKVLLHSNFMTQEPVSVAVFDGEQLLGRNAIIFKDSLAEVSFRLTNELLEHGFVSIEDDGLTYDNQLFSTLNPIGRSKSWHSEMLRILFFERSIQNLNFPFSRSSLIKSTLMRLHLQIWLF